MYEIDYTHKKQTGIGTGQFASVKLRLTETSLGSGVTFFNAETNGYVPSHFVPSIEKGVRDTLTSSGVNDMTVELLDGRYHDQDSSEAAFEICAHHAVTKALADMGL